MEADTQHEVFVAEEQRKQSFHDGSQPMPGVDFPNRKAEFSTERIREIANDIRKRQGLPPLT
jgi:hypothetical protein